MYIDTHTKTTMINSICKYFDINESELTFFLKSSLEKAQKNGYFDGDIFERKIEEFIKEQKNTFEIDEILFFHLGRRLNDASDLNDGKNLFVLLTTQNSFSNFLKGHEIICFEKNGHIEITFKNESIKLDNTSEANVCYLRNRLGYNEDIKDYCFNGFALKDLLYKNSYTYNLSKVPEFINTLCNYINYDQLREDYVDNSKYYCFEYLVKMEDVIFDGFDSKESLKEKQIHLIKAVLYRISDYIRGNIEYNSDENNPILRLVDDCILNEKCLRKKEEISSYVL